MEIKMLNKFFDIKPYDRNEVYLAVGKLIENALDVTLRCKYIKR